MTLQTGQKIRLPFRQMLIIATNLDPDAVMDPAFLRRMGYRLYLGEPSTERYAQIFVRYAARLAVDVEPSLIAHLIERYRTDRRQLRCCEPRDLIERARDICRFRGRPLGLNEEILDLAWIGYFGNATSGDRPNSDVGLAPGRVGERLPRLPDATGARPPDRA
jgi:hypothetical protein